MNSNNLNLPFSLARIMIPPLPQSHAGAGQNIHRQPRSQALPSCGGKTLAGAGHVTRGNLIAQGGVGKVSNYMLPLPHFTLRLQVVRVFCTK